MTRILVHGLKSLFRRPAKTGMLLIILFIVFNLIFTGFIIQNSIGKSKDYIRNQIGSAVEYRMDYTSMINGGGAPGQQRTTPPALSLAVAEKIAQNQYVESYYVTESANVNSDTIEPAETQESATGGFQRNFSDFNLSGTNQTANLDFVLGHVTLADGRTLTADEVKNGTNVVIVSQDVATANSLRVGDIVALSVVTQTRGILPGGQGAAPGGTTNNDDTTTATPVDYEVIGIYTAVEDGFDVNTMFTSNAVIGALSGTETSDETSGSIVFLLDDPDHVAAFKEEAAPALTSEYHTLYSDDTQYASLTKPLDLISFITSILLWVVFIAGAAIILALVTIFVRDRKFEIGLLLSSGEGRLKIVSQFVFEMMVIAIVAFSVSIVSSSATSKGVSAWIVDNQLLSQTSIIASTSTTTTANPMQNIRGFNNRSSVSLYGAVDMESVADEFNVSVDSTVVGQLMLASAALVLIGSTIPLTVIMGYKPRRILQDDN